MMTKHSKSIAARERVLSEAREKGAITHERACIVGHWAQAGYHLRTLCRAGLLEKIGYNTWKPTEQQEAPKPTKQYEPSKPTQQQPKQPGDLYVQIYVLACKHEYWINQWRDDGKDVRESLAVNRALWRVINGIEAGWFANFEGTMS
jgi:hypothetical protein